MSGADEYEKKYMGGEGALARSRAMMPWWFHLVLAVAAAVSVFSAIASGAFASLLGLPLLGLVWLLFLYLRVTVTSDAVHVQLGLFGPKIAIADVVEATVAKYDVLKYGGWGIRLGLDGSVAYSVPGYGGRGLRVRFNKGGKERVVFVTTPNPDELIAAIDKARGTRVAVVSEPASQASRRLSDGKAAERLSEDFAGSEEDSAAERREK
jgi:hypothetical protein